MYAPVVSNGVRKEFRRLGQGTRHQLRFKVREGWTSTAYI